MLPVYKEQLRWPSVYIFQLSIAFLFCCVVARFLLTSASHVSSAIAELLVSILSQWKNVLNIQGAPIKNNPLGKINYLSYCYRFFHQIYSFYWGGFRLHMQQISLQYLLWFKNYHYLNLKMHFSKWTSNEIAILV